MNIIRQSCRGSTPTFSNSVCNAHFKVMFIDIACLFERGNKKPGFNKLTKLLKNGGYDNTAKRIECAMSPHTCLIDSIRGFRNKRIAHHDTSWTAERILKEYGVTPNGIKLLLETFNELLVVVYKGVVWPNSSYPIARAGRIEEATFRLLHDLRDARKPEKMTTCSP